MQKKANLRSNPLLFHFPSHIHFCFGSLGSFASPTSSQSSLSSHQDHYRVGARDFGYIFCRLPPHPCCWLFLLCRFINASLFFISCCCCCCCCCLVNQSLLSTFLSDARNFALLGQSDVYFWTKAERPREKEVKILEGDSGVGGHWGTVNLCWKCRKNWKYATAKMDKETSPDRGLQIKSLQEI